MKTALLFSIAIGFFYINFMNVGTRLDDFIAPLIKADSYFTGDFVLLSGVGIAVAALMGIGETVAKVVKSLTKSDSVTVVTGPGSNDSVASNNRVE